MAVLRVCLAVFLTLLTGGVGAFAVEPAAEASVGLFDRPVLAVDLGMHTGVIRNAAADNDGRWAATASEDKTVRVWSLADGAPVRTIRLPEGPGRVDMAFAVSMSPDGALIATAGFTGPNNEPKQIYLFDRATGVMIRCIEHLPNVVSHLAFSPNGARLAAALAKGGLRVYAHQGGWLEDARDENVWGEEFRGVWAGWVDSDHGV